MDRALATRRPKLVIHVPVEPIVSHLIGNLARQQLIEGLQVEALLREAESLVQLGRYPCDLRSSVC